MNELNTQITGTINNLKRLPSSFYGNPRFSCDIGVTRCQTAPDAMVGYDMENHEGREVVASVRWYYGKLTIENIKEMTK